MHEYAQPSGKGEPHEMQSAGRASGSKKKRPTDKRINSWPMPQSSRCPHMALRVRLWLVTYSTLGHGTHIIETL